MKVRRAMPKFHRAFVLVLMAALIFSTTAFAQRPADADSTPPAGRSNLELRFDAQLKRENLRDWMKRLSARPHHAGSAYGKENAEFIAAQFRAWGYEARLEEFHVLFPTPKTR